MSEQTANEKCETGMDEQVFVPRLVNGLAQIMVNLRVYALPEGFARREVRVHTDGRGGLVKVTSMAGTRISVIPVESINN